MAREQHAAASHGAAAPEDAPTDEAPAEFETDAELGIGVDDAAPAASAEAVRDPLAQLLDDPRIAMLIDAAVAARVAALGVAPMSAAPLGAAAAPGTSGEALVAAMVGALDKLHQVQAQQQPHYQRPLSAAEVERRTAGFVEMTALCEKAFAAKDGPHYVTTGILYINDMMVPESTEVVLYDAPGESLLPRNETAKAIFAAYRQWIGGEPVPIAELVGEAERNRPRVIGGAAPAPLPFGGVSEAKRARFQTLTPPTQFDRRTVTPGRIAGTIAAEFAKDALAPGLPPRPVVGTIVPNEAA